MDFRNVDSVKIMRTYEDRWMYFASGDQCKEVYSVVKLTKGLFVSNLHCQIDWTEAVRSAPSLGIQRITVSHKVPTQTKASCYQNSP